MYRAMPEQDQRRSAWQVLGHERRGAKGRRSLLVPELPVPELLALGLPLARELAAVPELEVAPERGAVPVLLLQPGSPAARSRARLLRLLRPARREARRHCSNCCRERCPNAVRPGKQRPARSTNHRARRRSLCCRRRWPRPGRRRTRWPRRRVGEQQQHRWGRVAPRSRATQRRLGRNPRRWSKREHRVQQVLRYLCPPDHSTQQ